MNIRRGYPASYSDDELGRALITASDEIIGGVDEGIPQKSEVDRLAWIIQAAQTELQGRAARQQHH